MMQLHAVESGCCAHTTSIEHNPIQCACNNVHDHSCGSHSLWRKTYTGSTSYWFAATTTLAEESGQFVAGLRGEKVHAHAARPSKQM